MHNFRNMRIWSDGMDLSKNVLLLSNDFPKENRFDLTSQIIRSAVSISSNIAEGSSRKSNKEYSKFLDYSIGSAHELETQLILAKTIKMANENELQHLINETIRIQKMIMQFKKVI